MSRSALSDAGAIRWALAKDGLTAALLLAAAGLFALTYGGWIGYALACLCLLLGSGAAYVMARTKSVAYDREGVTVGSQRHSWSDLEQIDAQPGRGGANAPIWIDVRGQRRVCTYVDPKHRARRIAAFTDEWKTSGSAVERRDESLIWSSEPIRD